MFTVPSHTDFIGFKDLKTLMHYIKCISEGIKLYLSKVLKAKRAKEVLRCCMITCLDWR